MARLTLYRSQIENLLYDASGPVYKEVLKFGKNTEKFAKAAAPVESGELKDSIDATLPIRTAGFLTLRVGAPKLHDWAGNPVDYAFIVHQGHKRISPKRKKALRFIWEAQGGREFLGRAGQSVARQPAKPYLWEGMEAANNASGNEFLLIFDVVEPIERW